MDKIVQGNLNQNDPKRRGWFARHFMDEGSPFKTDDFEMQWRKLKAGEEKPALGTQKVAKTIGILVYGKFEFNFPDENKKITLSKEGEFVFFDAGVTHSWKVHQDTLLISIRWPSIPGDQKN
jgi:hypothetical protein